MTTGSRIFVFLILSACAAYHLAADQWKSLGPNGGDFTVIQISPSDSQVIYTGTKWGGVYKSTDAGDHWWYLGFGGEKIISSIAIDPHDPDIVYFSWYTASGFYRSGVSKSLNGGLSWQTVPLLSARTVGTMLATSNVVFVGNDHGLFRSTDGGRTFDSTAYSFGYNNFSVVTGDPKDSSVVFVGTDNAVYKCQYGGRHRQLLITGDQHRSHRSFA